MKAALSGDWKKEMRVFIVCSGGLIDGLRRVKEGNIERMKE